MTGGGESAGNSISVELARTSFYTGDVVDGSVVLETTRDAHTRGLTLDVLGRESTAITRGSGESSRTYRSTADHVAWRIPLLPEGVVQPGVHRYPFRFQVPVYALPSYQGKHAKVEYNLTARLDVPWWPDAVIHQPIQVFLARESVRTFAKPVRFRSGGAGPEIYVELDGDRFFARELVGCRITILRLGDHRVRRVYVRLVGGGWARAQNQEETTSAVVNEMDIPMGVIRLGEPFAFEIPLPPTLQSSYRGTYSYCTYVLQIGLDIAWAADLVAETPIVIVQ